MTANNEVQKKASAAARNEPTCDLLALESVVKIVRCAPHDEFGRSFREYLAVPAIPIVRSYIVDIVVNDLKAHLGGV